MKMLRVVSVGVLAAVLLLTSGCDNVNDFFSSDDDPSATATTTSPVTNISKPRPVVKSVEATTSGMENNYFAILEITIDNKGTDGTVIVHATLTQGGVTQTNEMITNLNKDKTQVLRLTFPLKWKGGEWTQSVEVTVP